MSKTTGRWTVWTGFEFNYTGWHRTKLCALYESMGFVKVGKKTIHTKDFALYKLTFDLPESGK